MVEPIHLEVIPHASLSVGLYNEIVALCTRAYDEDFTELLAPFKSSTHVVGYVDGQVVSHALWIPRLLFYNGMPFHSAYVEAVATEPVYQGRGYASAVMRTIASAITSYDVGALSPSDPAFYTRLGWEQWLGSLQVITDAGIRPTPEDSVMILRLPRTPVLDLNGTLTAQWRTGDIW